MAGTNWDRWSSLLPELLLQILRRMSCAADRVRFGSVCTRWRLVLTESLRLLPPTDPLVMLPYTEDDPYPCQVDGGIPVSWVHRVLLPDSRIEPTHLPNQQKMIKRKKVVLGSSMGWLFLYDCGVFSLWNPVTRAEIPLPLFVTVPMSIEKAALSSNPNSEDCVVMVIIEGTLSFCRVGDDKWTDLGGSFFQEVVFCQGQFYALTCEGVVVACNVGPDPNLTLAGRMHDYDRSLPFKDYLVESSSGELLKVTKISCSGTFKFVVHKLDGRGRACSGTFKFVVHKLDGRGRAGTWSKVESLGDQALFLGGSSSASLAASGGCRRNCIYFLDEEGCSNDMGMFDLSRTEASVRSESLPPQAVIIITLGFSTLPDIGSV